MHNQDSHRELEDGFPGSAASNSTTDNGNTGVKSSAADGSDDARYRLPLIKWLEERFTWSWFTCTQSTGGIAATLSVCPKQFDGLETIGIIIFIFNIALFLLFTAFMAIRWWSNPAKIRQCFVAPPECFFFGSFWLSAATMIINAQRYGVPHAGPWLVVAVRVLFWLYAATTLLNTTLHMVVIFKYTPFRAIEFVPAMFLVVLNAMLTGTVAGVIAESQPPAERLPIMVAGVAYQGLGWIVCMLFLTLTIANLLEKGWPPANLRPGLFILVGTSGFTIVALIGIAKAAPRDYAYFATNPTAADVVLIMATWVGVFLWLFSFWVFGLAFFVNLLEMFVKKDGKWQINMTFTNTAWSIIFPNVGWVISTVYLGQEFESEGVLWVSVAMTIALVIVWLLDLFLMAKTAMRSIFVDSRIKLA